MLNDCYIDKYQYTVVRNQTLTGAKVSPPWSPLNLGFSTGSRCHCRSTFSRCDGYRTHFSGGIGPSHFLRHRRPASVSSFLLRDFRSVIFAAPTYPFDALTDARDLALYVHT